MAILVVRWAPFHIYSDNSKMTPPTEKSITTKNVFDEISDNFCLNVMHVKHSEDAKNVREVTHGMQFHEIKPIRQKWREILLKITETKPLLAYLY